jgi:putative ATP-dependent endonuclease of OLD family
MIITKIDIKNFRSIKDLTFCPQRLCGLVGENNSGKTNVLRAINLLLGETWPTARSFSEKDFYNHDTSQPIDIAIHFKERSTPNDLSHVRLTYRWNDKPEFKVTYRAGGAEYYVSNAVKEQIALVYIEAERNLQKQLPMSSWTLFGKLLQDINLDFKTDRNKTAELEQKLSGALELLRTSKFREFEDTLKSSLKEQLGTLPYELDISFNIYNPLNYYRSIQLLARERSNTFDVLDLGSGLQNAILLSLFRTYALLGRSAATIAIEEPEIFLHPNAQRMLCSLLRNLTERGSQVFYTTHSSTFVDMCNCGSICVVRKIPHAGTQIQQVIDFGIEGDAKKEFETYVQFDPERNEMFFAKRVLLVEGDTEKVVFPIIAEKMGINLNDAGITIVECSNKHGITVFAPVLSSFRIPYVVVHDRDPGKTTEQENQRIATIVGDPSRIFILDPDFEAVASIPSGKSKPFNAFINFKSRLLTDIPQIFKDVLNKLLSL